MSNNGEDVTTTTTGSGAVVTNPVTTVTTMATTHVHRAPPQMKLDSQPYMLWKKDVQIWEALTSLPKCKQGLDVYMSLETKYKDFVGLSIAQLSSNDGVKLILDKLDELLLPNKDTLAYETFESFYNFRKESTMSMVEYISVFDQRYNKAAEYENTIATSALAFLLLKHARLGENDVKIVRTSIQTLDYPSMKKQLLSVAQNSFSSVTGSTDTAGPRLIPPEKRIKTEDGNEGEEVHWNWTYRGRGRSRSRGGRGRSGNSRSSSRGSSSRGRDGPRQNPVDPSTGTPYKCFKCNSTSHFAKQCVDVNETEEEDALMVITLFTSEGNDLYEVFLSETTCSAVLDSGCTNTCCGEAWLEVFLDTLTEEELKQVEYHDENRRYKFGSGDPITSTKSVTLPCQIAGKNVKIECSVVSARVPMLLSKKSMKKAEMIIDFGNDEATVFGKTIKLDQTAAGHYCLSLNKAISKLRKDEVVLYCKVPLSQQNDEQLHKSAIKLHRNFGHPTYDKLKKTIESAGEGSERLLSMLQEISENCDTSKRHGKVPPRPVVSIPMGTKFLEVVAMDLKHWRDNIWILHLIDSFSRYSSGCIVRNKKPETIVNGIFESWVRFVGVPKKFLTDNGGEFVNDSFMDMADNLNVQVLTTPAEAPWCNGIVERHNQVIGKMMEKLWEDGSKNLKQNLAWCLNAKNSMENNNGFTPYQLSIGLNPTLPNNLNAKLPALEGLTNSEVVAENLQTMNESRKIFTQLESSERLRRALRHNVRTYIEKDVKPGDWVYFKRNDSERWRGKAKVIYIDGKTVHLKHGGRDVKAHLSRVIGVDDVDENVAEAVLTEENQKIGTENQQETTHVEKSDTNELFDSEPDICTNEDVVVVPVNNNVQDEPSPIQNDIPPSAPTSLNGDTLPLKEKRVKYKLDTDDEWTMADVIGRGGKAKGANKNYINLQSGAEKYGIDWKRVEEWCPINDEEALVVESSELSLAKISELERWKENKVFSVVEDNGQSTIGVRWVESQKVIEGKRVVKCRLVAQGYQDPSKDFIRKDSPTAAKTSLRLATTYISSMGYEVKSFDISAAFLQGEEIEREVYLRPPPEANCDGLWKLLKTVYGLADASRKFYLKARKELLNLGCEMSSVDPAVFYWKKDGIVEGVFVTHVDDFYYGGTETFCKEVVGPLKAVFHLSSEHSQSFKYVGFEVCQEDKCITFSQNEYMSEIVPIEITKQREAMKDDPLSKEEQSEMRRRCGQLNWLVTHTRPDLSFDLAELSGRTSNLKVNDIIKINKLIGKIKSSNTKMVFPKLNDPKNLKLAVYADASLGNLPDGGSQGGYIILMVDSDGLCSPIEWQSTRIRRVVRSTLAAETLAMADALDAAILIEGMWKEMAGPNCNVSIVGITDCRSLFDAVNSSKAVTDKRLRMEMAMLREMQERGEVLLSWTETENQLADVLTKRGVNSLKLQRVLSTGHL